MMFNGWIEKDLKDSIKEINNIEYKYVKSYRNKNHPLHQQDILNQIENDFCKIIKTKDNLNLTTYNLYIKSS